MYFRGTRRSQAMNPLRLLAHAGLVVLTGAERTSVVVMTIPQSHAITRAITGASDFGRQWVMKPSPDYVLEARYISPSQIFLRFADNREGTWTFAELELDMSGMNLNTIRAAGTAVTVKSKWNDEVAIDAS